MNNQPEKTTSFFEFWPTKLMYTPVALQWLLLAIRYRSITLPLIANPKLTLAGMVGVAKSELMQQAQGYCQESILDWIKFEVQHTSAQQQAKHWLSKISEQGFGFPFVCKPDIGCRGSGVKLIHNSEQLQQCIKSYPVGTALLAQKLAENEPEAGIFYVRMPNENKGKVVSLTLKHSPKVIGDGKHTLKELLQQDPRASNLLHMYQDRHLEIWDKVLPKNQELNLIFSASHCHGAVFQDARMEITEELSAAIDRMMKGLPEFYYGRLDAKFENLQQLKNGKTIEIIEINGANAESIHIWDKNSSLLASIKTLLWQYSSLFKLGAYNRSLGYKPPGLRKFYKHWRIEKSLASYYPDTD